MVSLNAFLRDYLQFGYSVSEIVEQYVEWINEVMYMILSRQDGLRNEFFAVKCAKRGNDVYWFRVYRRFKCLCLRTDNLIFFNKKDRGSKKTRALWVTLTYNTKRCSFKDAWRNIGIEFNRFMSSVRRKFGKVAGFRVFEAFENGQPHIHCILFFLSLLSSMFSEIKMEISE